VKVVNLNDLTSDAMLEIIKCLDFPSISNLIGNTLGSTVGQAKVDKLIGMVNENIKEMNPKRNLHKSDTYATPPVVKLLHIRNVLYNAKGVHDYKTYDDSPVLNPIHGFLVEPFISCSAYAIGAVKFSIYEPRVISDMYTDNVRLDRNVAIAYVKLRCVNLEHFPNFQDDPGVIKAALRSEDSKDNTFVQFTGDGARGNKDLMTCAVERFGGNLEYVNDEFKEDREFVTLAVKNGYATTFSHAAAGLKNTPSVVLSLLQYSNGNAFVYASDMAKKNVDLCAKYVSLKDEGIDDVPDIMKNNMIVVLAAVRRCGDALAFVSDDLRDNEVVVTEAVAQDPRAILHASTRLKKLAKFRQAMLEANKISNFFPF
jgi:hypothetical protein